MTGKSLEAFNILNKRRRGRSSPTIPGRVPGPRGGEGAGDGGGAPGSDGAASFPALAAEPRTVKQPNDPVSCSTNHTSQCSLCGRLIFTYGQPSWGDAREAWIFGSTPFTGLPSQSWSPPPHFLLQKLLEFPASTEMQVPAPFVSPQSFELGDMKNTSLHLATQPGRACAPPGRLAINLQPSLGSWGDSLLASEMLILTHLPPGIQFPGPGGDGCVTVLQDGWGALCDGTSSLGWKKGFLGHRADLLVAVPGWVQEENSFRRKGSFPGETRARCS